MPSGIYDRSHLKKKKSSTSSNEDKKITAKKRKSRRRSMAQKLAWVRRKAKTEYREPSTRTNTIHYSVGGDTTEKSDQSLDNTFMNKDVLLLNKYYILDNISQDLSGPFSKEELQEQIKDIFRKNKTFDTYMVLEESTIQVKEDHSLSIAW